jgi:hypothetical protein
VDTILTALFTAFFLLIYYLLVFLVLGLPSVIAVGITLGGLTAAVVHARSGRWGLCSLFCLLALLPPAVYVIDKAYWTREATHRRNLVALLKFADKPIDRPARLVVFNSNFGAGDASRLLRSGFKDIVSVSNSAGTGQPTITRQTWRQTEHCSGPLVEGDCILRETSDTSVLDDTPRMELFMQRASTLLPTRQHMIYAPLELRLRRDGQSVLIKYWEPTAVVTPVAPFAFYWTGPIRRVDGTDKQPNVADFIPE